MRTYLLCTEKGNLRVASFLDARSINFKGVKWYKEIDENFIPIGATVCNSFIEIHYVDDELLDACVIEYELDKDDRATGKYLVQYEENGMAESFEPDVYNTLEEARQHIFENYSVRSWHHVTWMLDYIYQYNFERVMKDG